MVLGGVVYTAVPFYKRARKVEGTHSPIMLLPLTFDPYSMITNFANSTQINEFMNSFFLALTFQNQVLTEIFGL